MNISAQKRAFSLTMIVAILMTSILAGAFTPQSIDDNTTSTDQQFPFEENEKEFEDDKDEVDEKSNVHFLVCEFSPYVNADLDEANLVFLNSKRTRGHLPLFLINRTLLI